LKLDKKISINTLHQVEIKTELVRNKLAPEVRYYL